MRGPLKVSLKASPAVVPYGPHVLICGVGLNVRVGIGVDVRGRIGVQVFVGDGGILGVHV